MYEYMTRTQMFLSRKHCFFIKSFFLFWNTFLLGVEKYLKVYFKTDRYIFELMYLGEMKNNWTYKKGKYFHSCDVIIFHCKFTGINYFASELKISTYYFMNYKIHILIKTIMYWNKCCFVLKNIYAW